jgi:hypothetical protein
VTTTHPATPHKMGHLLRRAAAAGWLAWAVHVVGDTDFDGDIINVRSVNFARQVIEG